jgi:threonine dehydrogenase-like Zn-dependent dehydrogenase
VIAAGEVLVRTEIATICGSDVHVAAAATGSHDPGFPGHEAVGTVLETRADGFEVGDRVLCTPPAATARCFAELQAVAPDAMVKLPPGRPVDELVIAQQLGTAIFAMKRFWPTGMPSGGTAAVLGAGPAGLAFLALLRRAGFAHVLVSDIAPTRLASAALRGADTVADASSVNPVEIAMNLTDGRGVDLVIECAGRDTTRAQAMTMVRDEGRIGLFGLEEHGSADSTYPFAELFRRRPTIDMTWGAQFEPGLVSFQDAVALIVSGQMTATGMVSHLVPLSQIDVAFQLAADPTAGALKVALDPQA